MARNEEKQLARLNRLYLQQQREDELKKRPPRPKLDKLLTADDVKKWLPSIMRDIDFYIKQMEVTCYPQHHIENIENRIDHLRGEYKAFIRKLHQLQPDLEVTPWSDRPYAGKRRKTDTRRADKEEIDATSGKSLNSSINQRDDTSNKIMSLTSFKPINTPVLNNDSFYQYYYGYEKPRAPLAIETENPSQDEPLQFDFSRRSLEYNPKWSSVSEWTDKEKSDRSAPLELVWDANNSLVPADKKISAEDSTSHSKDSSERRDTEQKNVAVSVNQRNGCEVHSTTSHRHLMSAYHITPSGFVRASVDKGETCQKTQRETSVTLRDNQDIVKRIVPMEQVKKLGFLNIPYSDSSSSDEET